MAIDVPGRGPLGRPSKLTPDLQERLCEVIRQGHYISTACQAAGISHEALSEWRDRAQAGEEPYVEFVAAFRKAEAEGELLVWSTVLESATVKKDFIAASIAAERRWPERYGRRDRLDVQQHTASDIRIEVVFKALPQLEARAVIDGEVRELGPGQAPVE